MESAEGMFEGMFGGSDSGMESPAAVQNEAPAPAPQQPQDHGDDEDGPFSYRGEQPITDPSKMSLCYPGGIEVDPELERDFGNLAVRIGLTQKQAQALCDWEMKKLFS